MVESVSMELQKQTIILTNMIMLYRQDGSFLVENRLKKDWPGITFPGGHVERGESLVQSAIRESKEETGLTVGRLEPCGYFEWNLPDQNIRHLAILFRSDVFSGEIHSSCEGEILWLQRKDLPKYPLSTDFEKLLDLMLENLAFEK